MKTEAFKLGVGAAGKLITKRFTVKTPRSVSTKSPGVIISASPEASLPSFTWRYFPSASQVHSGKNPSLLIVFAVKTFPQRTTGSYAAWLTRMAGALNVRRIVVKFWRSSALWRRRSNVVDVVVLVLELEVEVHELVEVLVVTLEVHVVVEELIEVLELELFVSVEVLVLVVWDVVEVDICVRDT